MSRCRQNFHEDCEAAINKQINAELYASYVYMSMAYHFDRDDVALEGFFKFFKHQSDEEREHAEKLMSYQNKRGGRIFLQSVIAPQNEWSSHISALEDALTLEKKVNQSLLDLHMIATKYNDPHLSDYLESEFLNEQVDSINQISKLLTNAKRCGDGLGIYQFDKMTMASEDSAK
ncbi:soma ferritin [Hydra vulgaris]|uniref:Ferritin n=1 Tax=Hydra vulgaris TaxID=6087 RepID=T2MGZ7_HYDVU|nr:soma ferritin [Hydra vulgaris]